jgi:chaperone modulatory protein CbpM
MITTQEFLLHARLDETTLEAWIEAGWLARRPAEGGGEFADLDVARARLIRDLREDLGVNDEAVPVILDLLDQLHGLRRTLRGLGAAVSAQPPELRRQIVAHCRLTVSGGAPAEE